jgi:ribosomal protein S1
VSEASETSGAVTRLEDVRPKMKFTGTVKKIELFGAFVDIGVGRDGLLHISALGPKRVNKVEDVVKVGETVTVWVRKVDPQAGRIDLTLMEAPALDWSEIKAGQVHTGKVTKIEKFGAFVDIGAERPGMVHISELATYRVEEVSEIVKPGQEVDVKVLAVDARKRQIKLSIKALEAADFAADEEPEAPAMTAMQAALLKAQSAGGEGATKITPASRAKARSAREAQEELLKATLANKRK